MEFPNINHLCWGNIIQIYKTIRLDLNSEPQKRGVHPPTEAIIWHQPESMQHCSTTN